MTFGYLDVKIDNDRCFQCGNCLFVCPSDAIEHIPVRERNYNNNGQLVIEKKETPASAEELLVWHRQYHIRGMQIAEPEVDNWLPVLAALNLRLKALGEPIWQLTIIPPPPVDTGKRFALFRQKTISSGLNTGRARTGLNERKNSGRMTAGLMCARIRKTVFYVPPAWQCVRKGLSLLRIISLPWIRQNAAAA